MQLKDMLHYGDVFVNFLIPKKGDSKNVLIRKFSILAAIILIIVGIIVCCCYFAIEQNNKETAKKVNQSQAVTSMDTLSSKSSISEVDSGLQNSSAISSVASSQAVSSAPTSSKQTSGQKQTTTTKPPKAPAVSIDDYLDEFKPWFSVNKDVKGRLAIPNTNVNYPVTQANNNSYYLNHNEYKASSGWGVPFMDYRAQIGVGNQSTNITIYGHSDDKRGLQLSGVKKYKDIEFYKQNPVIEFDTIFQKGQWKVVGFFLEDVSAKNPIGAFQYHNYVNIGSEGEFNTFVSCVKERSFYDTPVDVVYGDRFVTISTCYSLSSQDFRYVFVARKVRDGESASVDTSATAINADRLVPVRPIQ